MGLSQPVFLMLTHFSIASNDLYFDPLGEGGELGKEEK